MPELVLLSGNRLNAKFRAGVEEMNLFWLGVSDKRRVYHLDGQQKGSRAKDLLESKVEREWLPDNDAGCRYVDLGPAISTIGRVRLIMVEQFDDRSRTLYLSNESAPLSDVYSALSNLRIREKGKEESGILFQMISLLKLCRESGIEAESATFDAWFCVPWFIKAVLELGFVRVITKPKATFNYHYRGISYKLSQLWPLLSEDDFKTHFYKGKKYQLASLVVEMTGLGKVKLTFARQFSRRGNKELSFILLSTDCDFPDEQVLRVYKLRWKIEVCYREVKQNHAFGNFHSQHANTNFGQTMLSLVAYTFVQLHQIMVPKLKEFTPGWIIDEYLGAIVNLIAYPDGQVVIELPSWLMRIGLPDWQAFAKPI